MCAKHHAFCLNKFNTLYGHFLNLHDFIIYNTTLFEFCKLKKWNTAIYFILPFKIRKIEGVIE